MKAKISRWAEEFLANPVNAYALADAIVKQGAEAMKKDGVIEFEAVVTAEDKTEKTEKIRLVSATAFGD